MFIISALSGTGKTTLANNVIKKDGYIFSSLSCTTRKKRSNEVNGVDYSFISYNEFKKRIKNKEFLEYTEIFDEFYGTPKKQVLEKLDQGKDVLFDINWEGQRQLSSIARADIASVFLLPPSKKELILRLKIRNEDSEEIIKKRTSTLNEEIIHWQEYDYVIVNRNFNQSLEKLLFILKSERLKKERRTGLNDFVTVIMTESINTNINNNNSNNSIIEKK